MSEIPLPRLKRGIKIAPGESDPGFWITADQRFVVCRPVLSPGSGYRLARHWRLRGRHFSSDLLLQKHGLIGQQALFATRREALQALATMMSAEGLA